MTSTGSPTELPAAIKLFGRWYEVSRFDHPGGPQALALGVGRDATALFVSSHQFSDPAAVRRHLAILEIHDVRLREALDRSCPDASMDRDSDFCFDAECAVLLQGEHKKGPKTNQNREARLPADKFAAEVRAAAAEYLRRQADSRVISVRAASKATHVRWAEVGILLVLYFLALWQLAVGSWHALLWAPTIIWIAGVNFWHDASHFAMVDNCWAVYLPLPTLNGKHYRWWRARVGWAVNVALTWLAPWFSSPHVWAVQHVLAHHCYSNVPDKDPDLWHAPQCWRFTRKTRWRAAHAVQAWTVLFEWIFAVHILALLKPLQAVASGQLNGMTWLGPMSLLQRSALIIGRLLTLACVYVLPVYRFWGESPIKALAFAVIPLTTISLWFMTWSQVNHHSPQNSLESGGSAAGSVKTGLASRYQQQHRGSRNWFVHQVLTSHTIAPNSYLAFLMSGGLNLQIEHHLFPTLNHCHLRALQPTVQALAAKYDIPYHCSSTLWEALGKFRALLAEYAHRVPTEVE